MTTIAFERLSEVFSPLAYLLAAGGDTRLLLDQASRLNAYGCRPYPRPEAFTFASSTATSISERAYRRAEAAREDLIRASMQHGLDLAFDERVEELRRDLEKLLGIEGMGAAIVLSPSGTDGELQALFVARSLGSAPLTNVLAAADETGSGVALASAGRHFSSLTALGALVAKGEPIAGLAEDVTSIGVPLRGDAGHIRSGAEMDAAVLAAIAGALAAGRRVSLHVMDHSKLGTRCPSLACLAEIKSRWGDAVAVVIDACQMRLGRPRLRWHLDQGHMVLVTGSKFFTGPPFCGALLVPAAMAARMAEVAAAPEGFADYTSRSDWPREWTGVRSSLRERANLGQYLRWVAAAQEMRDYFAVPLEFRKFALGQFAEIVSGLIALEENLELLPDRAECDPDGDEEFAARTILPFLLRRTGRALSLPESAMLYRALNDDVSAFLPATAGERQRRLAAQPCHIGQPVAVTDPASGAATAALRISAGARVVSENWSAEGESVAVANLRGEFEQVRAILAKIDLLLRNFDIVERAEAERDAQARNAPDSARRRA